MEYSYQSVRDTIYMEQDLTGFFSMLYYIYVYYFILLIHLYYISSTHYAL